jgi:hypothetical protein
MPDKISSLGPEAQRALWPSLLHIITRKHATTVNVLTEKFPQTEGEVAITIRDNKDNPTEA